mmetsp:Transcript_29506/g.44844  ORF Transcript_29506/g.44844 Transcript_29506/m.44844 type:complete len:254 (+) Transcript_29506:27-788(+)
MQAVRSVVVLQQLVHVQLVVHQVVVPILVVLVLLVLARLLFLFLLLLVRTLAHHLGHEGVVVHVVRHLVIERSCFFVFFCLLGLLDLLFVGRISLKLVEIMVLAETEGLQLFYSDQVPLHEVAPEFVVFVRDQVEVAHFELRHLLVGRPRVQLGDQSVLLFQLEGDLVYLGTLHVHVVELETAHLLAALFEENAQFQVALAELLDDELLESDDVDDVKHSAHLGQDEGAQLEGHVAVAVLSHDVDDCLNQVPQ